MGKALHAELQKARRRHDLLICLGRAGGRVSLGRGAGPHRRGRAGQRLQRAFVRAARSERHFNAHCDGTDRQPPVGHGGQGQHHKTCCTTLQSRRSLFAGKALLGTGEVLLMVTLEMAVSILLGRVQGYTEALPAGPFVYTGICTLAVDVMLFFSELLLMLIFDNPLPALCVGIVGALIGLFSAFMPPLVSYFVPWGYFVPLSCYEIALWDRATHTVTYGLLPYNWGLLAFTVVLAAALFAAAWRMMRDKEV